MAKIFTIIVTYNGEKWLKKCLEHLLQSNCATRIVIVDNASSDNSLNIIQSFGDKIHLIKSPVNLGFGQANNIAIKYAMKNGADFVFLLNQDAYVYPQTVLRLSEALEKFKDFGVLSPLQLAASGDQIEPIFCRFLKRNFDDRTVFGFMESEQAPANRLPYKMRFVNAAAWMMSKECINRTGLFHPVFFHYGEDNHYSSRVQYHHLKIGVLPAASVIHDCREEIQSSHDHLLRQIKNIPLYTLLDLRKPLILAYLLGLNKWRRISNKLKKFNDADDLKIISDQKKWFFSNIKEALTIRKETKKQWNPDVEK